MSDIGKYRLALASRSPTRARRGHLGLLAHRPRARRTQTTSPRSLPVAAEHPAAPPKSAVHKLALLAVWMAVFSSFFVVREPAPVDALLIGLIVLLPVVGLAAIERAHLAYLSLWSIVVATGFGACFAAIDWISAATHIAITAYLALASFVLAAFVAKQPDEHATLILRAYVAAALVAALAGVAGYLELFPYAKQFFTVHARATGSFKDPNVFAPFLIPPFLYLLHVAVSKSLARASLALLGMGALMTGLVFSFSRGAWVNLTVAVSIYAILSYATARTHEQRLKLIATAIIGLSLLAALLTLALASSDVSRLLIDRVVLTQSYDEGPQGRFGGQLKAWGLMLEHPLGLGALQFGGVHHIEHPHNVYVSQLLNGGWIGGFTYLAIIAASLAVGLRAVMQRQWPSRVLLVVYAAFAGLAVEGLVIETDHWRTFYLVLGMLWGLAFPAALHAQHARGPARLPLSLATLAPRPPTRAARIVGMPNPQAVPAVKRTPRQRLSRRQARIVTS